MLGEQNLAYSIRLMASTGIAVGAIPILKGREGVNNQQNRIYPGKAQVRFVVMSLSQLKTAFDQYLLHRSGRNEAKHYRSRFL